jgi:hypothetical protein
MGNKEFVFHVTVDPSAHIEFAWAYIFDNDFQARWVGDCEFGPFDGYIDLAKWMRSTAQREIARPAR